ncbi:uncharacterized protein LOC143363777 [Halictus rubicundus]|uniref:uncharacterized protein LOC143363777 n=1 Tax=Halictus rubicundus TaxID=77578 RepID=UPI00403613EA
MIYALTHNYDDDVVSMLEFPAVDLFRTAVDSLMTTLRRLTSLRLQSVDALDDSPRGWLRCGNLCDGLVPGRSRKHAAKNRVAKLEVHNQETQEQSIEDIPEKMDVAPTMTSDTDCFVAESSTREETSEKSTIAELSIVDLRHIFEEMKKLESHSETLKCCMANLTITGRRRLGLATKILIECKMCKYKTEINSESAESDRLNINCSAVAGTITSGGGYIQMEEMFSAMNIPCMSRWIYRKCHDDIVETSINAAEAEMIAAAEEEKRLATERGDVLPSGIRFIPVVADGSWMKRSYRTGKYDSMAGVSAIIGYHTQKVLFAGVKNKMCVICHNAAKKNEKPKKHSCFKNWGRHQTSTKMESDAIADGFETSIKKRGLVYATLIADGDSSVYKKILDCDPYKAAIVRVKKIECTNHLLRNFCNKLKDIAKTTPPGKYRKAVESSVRRMRTDITEAAEYRVKENVSINRKINNLQKDLTNIPSHVFGEHKECRRLGYICDRIANNDEENMVPHLMEIGIYYKIQDIFRPLIAHAESLLYNSNNNSVESFNSIIAKYTGGQRINWS